MTVQWLSIQQELQQERVEIGKQRDQLETDRRTWTSASEEIHYSLRLSRRRRSCSGCSLPLLIVLLLLWQTTRPTTSVSANELLVTELITRLPAIDTEYLTPEACGNEPPRLTDDSD